MPSWRIEFFATAPPEDTTSGLSRVVWELGSHLAERGHTVRVLFPTERARSGGRFHGVEAVPVPVIGLSRRPFGRDIEAGRVASACLDPEADIVVGNDEKAGALRLPRRRRGRPVFAFTAHDVALHTFDTLRPLEPDRGLRQKVGNWLDRRTLKRLESAAIHRAEVLLAGSEKNRELLHRYYGISPNRITVLPLGVPDPVDVGPKDAARLALRIPPDVPVVLFVGRTPERQGLDVALAAFRRIRGFFPGARLLVVGSAPAVEPGVVPLGTVDEETKARAYRAADVFLFPTRYEGFGLAPREAMRYGLPAIVSRHVPLEGAVPPVSVRVVPSDDPAEYAAELAELVADPALRRSVGEAGKAYADQFTFGKMAERFESLFVPRLAG